MKMPYFTTSIMANRLLEEGMITEQEHEALLDGQMVIEGNTIMNLNIKHPRLKTGEKEELSPDRALYILHDRLMKN
jgi:hypothetical protein